jgi:hypothetical protein
MINAPVYFCVITMLLTGGCAGNKAVTNPAEWKGRSLQFGSGGGISGMSNIYTLLENGQIFLESGMNAKTTKELTRFSKKEVKELFEQASKITWPEKDVSEPGDLYYQLAWNGAGKRHAVTWGNGKYNPPAEMLKLYNNLQSLINSSKKP